MNRIATKIGLSIALCCMATTLLVGIVSGLDSRSTLTEQAHDSLRFLMSSHGQELDHLVVDTEQALDSAENLVLTSLDPHWVRGSHAEIDVYRAKAIPQLTAVATSHGLHNLYLYFDLDFSGDGPGRTISVRDTRNSGIYEVRPETDIRGLDMLGADMAWYRDALRHGESWTTPYYWSNYDLTLVSYTREVRSRGMLVGVLGTDFVLDDLIVLMEDIRIYDSGQVVLLSEELDFLYPTDAEDRDRFDAHVGSRETLSRALGSRRAAIDVVPLERPGADKLICYYRLSNGWLLVGTVPPHELYASVRRTAYVTAGAVLIGLLFALAAAVAAGRRIGLPVRAVSTALRDLSRGTGDLSGRLPAGSTDEVGEMSSYFNRFLDRLGDIVASVRQHADDGLRSAESVRESMRRIAHRSGELARSTTETAVAVEQLSVMSADIAELAESSRGRTEELSDHAVQGGEAVRLTIDGVRQLEVTVADAEERALALSRRVEGIENISRVIHDIAVQINLLALNASIEASKAGEAGKGFAVVANEVRDLARKTSKSTGDIAALIDAVETETGAVTETMRRVRANVQQGVGNVEATAHRFGAIQTQLDDLRESAQQVAAVSQQQTASIAMITDRIGTIQVATRDTTIALEEGVTIVKLSASIARNMNQIVGMFRLRDDVA